MPTSIDDLDRRVTALESRMDANEAEQSAVNQKLNLLIGSQDAMFSLLRDHGRELQTHRTLLAQQSGILEQHSAILAEHSGRLAEHSSTLAEHSAKLEEHDRRFDAVDAKLSEHDRRFDAVDGKLDMIVEWIQAHP